MRYHVTVDGQQHEVEIVEDDQGLRVKVNDREVSVDLVEVTAPSLYSLLLANHSYELLVEEREGGYDVFLETELYETKVQSDRARRLAGVRATAAGAHAGETEIKAPMPGLVVTVEAKPGDEVARGQGLIILEAMKMENELKSPCAGTVKAMLVRQGDKVTQGQTLVVLG